MNKNETQYQFVYALLALLAEKDCFDAVYWHCESGEITFYVLCNDIFYWASADAEKVTVDDLPALRQAFADVQDADCAWADTGLELWVARKRKMRPQQPAYSRDTRIRALFDACGPVRDPREEGWYHGVSTA